MPDTLLKDEVAVLDYKFDWTSWLEATETIQTATVTVPAELTLIGSETITDAGKSVTVWLSVGVLQDSYRVPCVIVTTAGRTDKRTLTIRMQDR